jgi:hypothetical protein
MLATVSGCSVEKCTHGLRLFFFHLSPEQEQDHGVRFLCFVLFSFYTSIGYISCYGVDGAFQLGCLRVLTHILHIPVYISFSHIDACYAYSTHAVSLVG